VEESGAEDIENLFRRERRILLRTDPVIIPKVKNGAKNILPATLAFVCWSFPEILPADAAIGLDKEAFFLLALNAKQPFCSRKPLLSNTFFADHLRTVIFSARSTTFNYDLLADFRKIARIPTR